MRNILLAVLILPLTLIIMACFLSSNQSRISGSKQQGQASSVNAPKSEVKSVRRDLLSAAQKMLDEKVVAFYQWEVDMETPLLCLVRNSGKPEFPGDKHHTLSIIDKQGKLLYEDKSNEILQMSKSYVLRNDRSQLVVKSNGGGLVNSLQILDYRQGNITSLLEEAENSYEIDAQVRPSFRKGVDPASEPYEILLINGGGLPSPIEKETSIYRYSNGAYRFAGKFPQKQLDNYIEELLKGR